MTNTTQFEKPSRSKQTQLNLI